MAHSDSFHPQIGKTEQLAALADTVLVRILPQLDAGKRHITRIKLAIGHACSIRIQISQCRKAVADPSPRIRATGE